MSGSRTSDHRVPPASTRFAMLRLDGTTLALPQRVVRAIEALEDVEPSEPPPGGIGWIAFSGRRRPVYSITHELLPSSAMPLARRMCAIVGDADTAFALACDEVEVVELAEADLTPLPACMRLTGSPVAAVARWRDGVACVVAPGALAALLGFVPETPESAVKLAA